MNKKIFLTSAAIMCMACPAIAETFPQDGNMLENKTYDNAATYANTGIYEGDVTADAEYSLNPYSVAAGSYFTGIDNSTNQATTAQCTSGNYCPGVASTTFDNNAFGDTGLQTCPSGYASSDLGASANTQCYRTCDIANMGENGTIANIAHAATLSGNDYYGNGADTCEPATCVAGWHVKSGNPDLMTLIGVSEAGNGYTANTSTGSAKNSNNMSNTIIANDPMAFAVDYGTKGIIKGHGRCSTRSATDSWVGNNYAYVLQNDGTVSNLTDETGQSGARYCYCHLDSYTPVSGSAIALTGPWVFFNSYRDAGMCANECANECTYGLRHDDPVFLAFRAAMFGAYPAGSAMCEANTINITWNDASAEDIAATGAATTVYEGDIKTPLKAITKPGKTFVGWKFIKPQQ